MHGVVKKTRKSMEKRHATLVISIVLFCMTIVGVSLAQERTVGVSVGNEFTYHETSFFSGNHNATLPAGLEDINMTEYYRVTVTGVKGSNVSTHTLLHFKNGTEVESIGSVSAETNAYQGGFWAIIGSNLNAGERVHPNSVTDLSTINETLPWDYGGYERQTNHLSLVFRDLASGTQASFYAETVDTYFDQQTGALVKLVDRHEYGNPTETTLVAVWELVSQNAWNGTNSSESSQHLTIGVIIFAAFIIALVSMLIYRKRHGTSI